MTVALTEERKEEIYRQASLARAFGVGLDDIFEYPDTSGAAS